MNYIAVIGAGQIGSRHLQSLARIDFPAALQVVDPHGASLSMAKERYGQMPENGNVVSIDFLTSLDDLSPSVDLAIIATASDVRFRVFHELTEKKHVSNVVFEKVLFQSEQHFSEADRILARKNISAWVNCPMRLYPVYRDLKRSIDRRLAIDFAVTGSAWGLACNAIHYLDLMAFLSGDTLREVDETGLDAQVWPSKRQGFIELTGRIRGTYSAGGHITLQSGQGDKMAIGISLKTPTMRVELDELSGQGTITKQENEWVEEPVTFRIPYQSELTHVVVKEILEKGACSLAQFEESKNLHLPFLQAVARHLKKIGRSDVACPIT